MTVGHAESPRLCPHGVACNEATCPWGFEIDGVAAEEDASGECLDGVEGPAWATSGFGGGEAVQSGGSWFEDVGAMWRSRRGGGMQTDDVTSFVSADA